jgi:transcription-repair coupling factor (superfamily II helicase)
MDPEKNSGNLTVQESDIEPWLDGLSAVDGLLGRPHDDLAISGLLGGAPACVLAGLFREKGGRWLVVCPELADAESLCDDLDTWQVGKVHYLPELEILPFDRKSPTREIQASIQSGLQALAEGEDGFFVTTIYGLRHKVMSAATLRNARLELRAGQAIDTDAIGERLASLGYRPAGVVEQPGDMAIRGGLIDIFSPAHTLPMRLELFGDEIESIRLFEPTDQRSRDTLDHALVLPAGPLFIDDDTLLEALSRVESCTEVSEDDRTELIERLQDRLHFAGIEGLAPFFHEQVSLLEYFAPEDTIVFLAPDELARRDEVLDEEVGRVRQGRIRRGDPVPERAELIADKSELTRLIGERRRIWLGDVVLAGNCPAPLGPPAGFRALNVQTHPQERAKGDVDALLGRITTWEAAGTRSVIFCDNRGQADRLAELIEESPTAVTPELRVGTLHAGFVWEAAQIALLTDHELFDRYRRSSGKTRFRGTGKVADSGALKPGDYCVHVDHGIARFLGLRQITADSIESECLLLEYAEGDRLYVPTDKLLLVERYDIPDDETVQLHKLGGATWDRTKKRARKAILAVAQELLTLYASRETLPGIAFSPDNHYLRELENAFIHEETRDQTAAVMAVKHDMEQSRPMDRLVCGDVGFGKTEVAMRAAFKAVQDDRQVAVLCPTTILAEQHGETFSQRMREFPVTVEVLSRFRTAREQKDVLKRTAEGKVDILVGTHRLLSRDVRFNKLGLLVVDEEQRFGVRHKERLKEMRKQVDVLTLSATPIPRTLYLALMGARDLSIIATPPRDRLPILTEVTGFSEELVAEALRREMHRGGQVFFVHNRIETIDAVAAMVRKLVGEARVLVAHGQMGESELESIMKEFIAGEADVLVTTMIIESGLDMPNVNTILIDRADRLGLSQLHQLRGRVGRSRHQAYAFLMVPPDQTLSREARARLAAIQEFTDLGSGYHVAMRDLEIRGAGNILGESQSGHITAIGFDLYCKMLEEEVRTLKGEGLPRLQDVSVDLRSSAFLPDEYMADPEVKIRWYRELGRVADERQLDDLADELRDRFGNLPAPVQQLIDITRLRLRCLQVGVGEVKGIRRGVRFVFTGETPPDSSILKHLIGGTGLPKLTFNAVQGLQMIAEVPRDDWVAAALVVSNRLVELIESAADDRRITSQAPRV